MSTNRNLWREPFSRGKRVVEYAPAFQHVAALKQLQRELTVILDPYLGDSVHGWRRHRSVATAVADIESRPGRRIHGDIASYFSNIDQERLRRMLDGIDRRIWGRIEPWMPEYGLPEGASISPVLANLYLSDIDKRFPIVRYADNLLLIAPDPGPLFSRLRRQLTDIGLVITPSSIEYDPTHFCKTPLRPPFGLPGEALGVHFERTYPSRQDPYCTGLPSDPRPVCTAQGAPGPEEQDPAWRGPAALAGILSLTLRGMQGLVRSAMTRLRGRADFTVRRRAAE